MTIAGAEIDLEDALRRLGRSVHAPQPALELRRRVLAAAPRGLSAAASAAKASLR